MAFDFKRSLLLSLLLCTLVPLAGCLGSDPDAPESSKTVDVPPALEIPIENDEVAKPRVVEISGVLPTNFPPSLALHKPSSLVGFGDEEDHSWVSFLTDDARSRVEPGLLAGLRNAGWSTGAGGDVYELRRGDRTARLVFRESDVGTAYRYEY